MIACLENAVEAIRDDPLVRWRTSSEARASRRLWRAVVLAPTLEVCEALLAGESVPVDRLDSHALARFRPKAAA